jgi:hypothetical protein
MSAAVEKRRDPGEGRERGFVLPDGYLELRGGRAAEDGSRPEAPAHREGRMRPATAADEMRALGDFRVALRPQSFLPVLLARVVPELGGLPAVDVGIMERLSQRDLRFLESLYREMNGYDVGAGSRG